MNQNVQIFLCKKLIEEDIYDTELSIKDNLTSRRNRKKILYFLQQIVLHEAHKMQVCAVEIKALGIVTIPSNAPIQNIVWCCVLYVMSKNNHWETAILLS